MMTLWAYGNGEFFGLIGVNGFNIMINTRSVQQPLW